MRRVINASLFCGLSMFMLAGNAAAGGVANQFRSGAFGLPWSANKAAIQAKFKRDNGIEYKRPQILVSTGAKQTIYNLFMAVIDPGDEVIIPAPYWVSYPDMALLADGVPVTPYAGPEQGYKITAAQLEAAITPRSRVFMLNSPSNPTGAAYTRQELLELGGQFVGARDVARRKGCRLVDQHRGDRRPALGYVLG